MRDAFEDRDWRPATREEITEWWRQVRIHHDKASEASALWNRRKERLAAHIEQQQHAGRHLPDFTVRKMNKENDGLNDAMDAWAWNRREELRWAAQIETELAMRQLLGMEVGSAWAPIDHEG